MKITTWAFAGALLASWWASWLPATNALDSKPAARTSPEILEQFEVFGDGDCLLVPVTVNEKTYLFLVDTGASVTLYDTTILRGAARGSTTMNAANQEVKVRLFDPPEALVGKQRIKHQPIQTLNRSGDIDIRINGKRFGDPFQEHHLVPGHDLWQFRHASGHEIYGILGMDFLADYVVAVDFDRGTLSLQRSADQKSAESIPLERSSFGTYQVRATIGQWGGEMFVLDTGCAGYGCIRKELFQTLRINQIVKDVEQTSSLTLAGVRQAPAGVVPEFVLGSQRLSAPWMSGDTLDNLVGLRFLARFNPVLDFPNQRLFLRKNKNTAARASDDASGFTVVRSFGRTIVKSVVENGAAHQAGIRRGDELLEADGRPAAKWRIFELHRLSSSVKKQLVLKVLRDEQEIELKWPGGK